MRGLLHQYEGYGWGDAVRTVLIPECYEIGYHEFIMMSVLMY